MKIFPIKVEKSTKPEYKFIEWKIHNVCNYNCSFCGDTNKDGSLRWFDLDKYKEYADKLIEACGDSPFWIQVTGGEPTLYPDLIPLLEYMKTKGAMLSLISNGSRTIRWWKEFQEKKLLDNLMLSYHGEQTDNYKHIAEVANLFHNDPIEVICMITHVHGTLAKAYEAQDYLIKNTGAFMTVKAMAIKEYDIYKLYTEEEMNRLLSEIWIQGDLKSTKAKSLIPSGQKTHRIVKVTYNDETTEVISTQLLTKQQRNKFLNWDCDIGSFSINIDHDAIYRGTCKQGERRTIYDDNIAFNNDFISCKLDKCTCGTDIISTKILPKDMYPKA
jgi:organic radical activating enzyme